MMLNFSMLHSVQREHENSIKSVDLCQNNNLLKKFSNEIKFLTWLKCACCVLYMLEHILCEKKSNKHHARAFPPWNCSLTMTTSQTQTARISYVTYLTNIQARCVELNQANVRHKGTEFIGGGAKIK